MIFASLHDIIPVTFLSFMQTRSVTISGGVGHKTRKREEEKKLSKTCVKFNLKTTSLENTPFNFNLIIKVA